MKDAQTEFDPDLTGLDRPQWIDALDEVAEDFGAFDPLGPDHQAAFIDAGRCLVVTFETIQSVRGTERDEPLCFALTRKHGWSSLSLISDGDTWFRHKAVYGYFDRLVDDGFFEDFDQVVFFGAGHAGYAACAYSVAAPGARVLALRPQSTLDPTIAGWDHRYPKMRRTSFSDRYGYAPDMIDGVDKAFIIYNRNDDLDAMHASHFARPHSNATLLQTTHTDMRLERDIEAMGLTHTLIEAAMDDTLSRQTWATLWRARREHVPYLRKLVGSLEGAGRTRMLQAVCEFATTDQQRPFFQKRLNETAEDA